MQKPEKNPIRAMRELLGLTAYELSAILVINATSVFDWEKGKAVKLTNRAIAKWSAAGFDGPGIAKEYEAWRIKRGETLRAAL